MDDRVKYVEDSMKQEAVVQLLESARRLMGRLESLRDGVSVIENRLDFQGDLKGDESKLPSSSLSTYLDECHSKMSTLEAAVDRILARLGE